MASIKDDRRSPLVGEHQSIEVLTHGIFAITMTLLILELRVPETESDGHLWDALKDLTPNVAAYLFGFVYLMALWLSLRAFFRDLDGISRSVTILLLVVIGAASLTPFTVSTMATAIGDSHDLGVAVRLMAAVVGFSYLVAVCTTKLAWRQGLVPTTPWYAMSWPRAALWSVGPAVAGFALSYLNAWVGLAVLAIDIVLGVIDPSEVGAAPDAEPAADPAG